MRLVPEIETERLRLRSFRESDLGAWARTMADAEVVRYLGGQPFAREDVWRRLAMSCGLWQMLGFGYWVLEEKATGAFVGEAGLLNLNRAIEPPLGDAPEAGWVLAPEAQGKGYATEAMTRALAWTEEQLRPVRTVCMISPQNTPSIRVAEKLGYREYVRTAFKGSPTILLERRS